MKLVILDAITLGKDVDLTVFEKFGRLTIYETTASSETIDKIADADIVITNKVLIDKNVLESCPTVKLVCITATGTNNVDLEYAKTKGVEVKNVKGYSTGSVAQHTFVMLLNLMFNATYYSEYVRSGKYSKSGAATHIGPVFHEIDNKQWGIIGLGEIGRRVAEIAQTFGANVVYYSTSGKNSNNSFKRLELDELLKTSDIVSIHAPLNEQTLNLLNEAELNLLKPTAYLLNVGRGGIINEQALANFIAKKEIGGVALDVLENEPLNVNSPLSPVIVNPKLFVTPHVAWASVESRKRLVKLVVKNIEEFIA